MQNTDTLRAGLAAHTMEMKRPALVDISVGIIQPLCLILAVLYYFAVMHVNCFSVSHCRLLPLLRVVKMICNFNYALNTRFALKYMYIYYMYDVWFMVLCLTIMQLLASLYCRLWRLVRSR